MNFYGKYNLRY